MTYQFDPVDLEQLRLTRLMELNREVHELRRKLQEARRDQQAANSASETDVSTSA